MATPIVTGQANQRRYDEGDDQRWRRHANQYLLKHQLAPGQITPPPAADLGIVVVIPAYDEPQLSRTLARLQELAAPQVGVEILVVLNASEVDDDALRERHRQARDEIRHSAPRYTFPVHVTEHQHLPKRHAGVGLARKLGLDEGVRRLLTVGNGQGLLVSLDADCVCESNYFVALAAHFAAYPRSSAANIYFEHPLIGNCPAELDAGIVRYELFLRYHVYGLRFAGAPYAFQTLGSCMAVRAWDYVRQGGMNRRQGGEDFYFLQKYFRLGSFSEVRTTTVRPSARISTRAPFGTGQAQMRWLDAGVGQEPKAGLAPRDQDSYPVYAPVCYQVLREFYAKLDGLTLDSAAEPMSQEFWRGPLLEYLQQIGFPARVAEIRANVGSEAAFRKRLHRWFDGFRAVKALHWLTAYHYPKEPVGRSALTLLDWLGRSPVAIAPSRSPDLLGLLKQYRQFERQGWLSPGLN